MMHRVLCLQKKGQSRQERLKREVDELGFLLLNWAWSDDELGPIRNTHKYLSKLITRLHSYLA